MNKIQPSKDCEYSKDDQLLSVFVRGTGQKGARAKGQKFIKSKGVYDGTLWLEDTLEVSEGTIFIFKLTSASVSIKKALSSMVRGVKL